LCFVLGGTPDRSATAQPAAPLFADWPKGVKPDAVLVVTGQTYGYLQPCGCSRPQLGGLERRATFVKGLRDKGWPVAGIDLGDIPPVAGAVPEQVLLKYSTTLPALREMGYVAVGVGKAEIANGLFRVLDQYAGKKEQPPYVLGGNLGSSLGGRVTPRAEAFPGPGPRPLVGLTEVVKVGDLTVGIASVAGPSLQKAVAALGPKTLVGFTPEKDALDAAAKQLAADPKKPALNVLLYQGTLDEAKQVAKVWPQFTVIVCLSDDSEPPESTTVAAKSLIVRVGHKGRYVGVVGVFKSADGVFDLKYQLVPLGEEYVTPGTEDAARTANPALRLLDDYAATVKERNMLGKFPAGPHPAQVAEPKREMAFVGSEACKKCHADEYAKWEKTKHSHAFDALEKLAKRPALRQFDGECAVCHTVGFGYKSGYRDELTTPGLKHVGCESCHGPGSGHSADPKNARLLALQVPWRQDPGDRMPDPALFEQLGKMTPAERLKAPVKPGQRRAANAITQLCLSCHDTENDPRFDIFSAWPQIVHPSPKK
jgi:hypothetical protein